MHRLRGRVRLRVWRRVCGTRRPFGDRPRSASARSRCWRRRTRDWCPRSRARSNASRIPLRPVLVVTGHHHQTVAKQLAGTGVGVDVGRVRDVVAAALEEADERELRDLREVRVVRRRPVRRLHRPLVVRPVEGDVVVADAVEVEVEAPAAPVVVGLPGVDRCLDEDVRVLPRRLAHDERHPAPAARRPALR